MNDVAEFKVPDITARKNFGLVLAEDYTLAQPLDRYTEIDHQVWSTLYHRQMEILKDRACDEFFDGLQRLPIEPNRVPVFDELNQVLQAATGWKIVAVHGLIPDEVFFHHLANRRFPVTWWLREASQIDYLQEPDVFHDLFGHVPLLANPVFADYLAAYGKAGLAAQSENALHMLARLYWYTVEFGLIQTSAGLRIYGAGIVSSRTESIYSLESNAPNRVGFDMQRILQTRYRIDTFQKTYFVIDSFERLFTATSDFQLLSQYYAAIRHLPAIGAGEITPTDVIMQVGSREGWSESEDL